MQLDEDDRCSLMMELRYQCTGKVSELMLLLELCHLMQLHEHCGTDEACFSSFPVPCAQQGSNRPGE